MGVWKYADVMNSEQMLQTLGNKIFKLTGFDACPICFYKAAAKIMALAFRGPMLTTSPLINLDNCQPERLTLLTPGNKSFWKEVSLRN